uniref:Uncharacterized protein n=1 Tax=Arundo donax TaxID=35708 RepID=A0A0A9ENW3_ARUDO
MLAWNQKPKVGIIALISGHTPHYYTISLNYKASTEGINGKQGSKMAKFSSEVPGLMHIIHLYEGLKIS